MYDTIHTNKFYGYRDFVTHYSNIGSKKTSSGVIFKGATEKTKERRQTDGGVFDVHLRLPEERRPPVTEEKKRE